MFSWAKTYTRGHFTLLSVVLLTGGILAFLAINNNAVLQPDLKASLISKSVNKTGKKDAAKDYGKLPIYFITNRGQLDSQVKYYATGAGYNFYLTKEGVTYSFTRQKGDNDKASHEAYALKINFAGANPKAKIEGQKEQGAKVNYFIGKDKSDWKTSIPTFAQAAYKNLYPGIDLAYQGKGGKLKYEFVVAPGADYRKIKLSYTGADSLRLDKQGNLLIVTPAGSLKDERPYVYQIHDDKRVRVNAGFKINNKSVGFWVSGYDAGQPLVIDPGLVYSTFLGEYFSGSPSISVDSSGSAYVSGFTASAAFPTTAGAFDTTRDGFSDVFVSKLNASGGGLVYSTFLGGTFNDDAMGIAVDSSGNAYISGSTVSTDYPTTGGAFRASHSQYADDVFVSKLNAAGSDLVYSTFLGGGSGQGIAVDSSGSAYITGRTSATDFPTTTGAFNVTPNGFAQNIFVAKLSTTGSDLVYSTFLGESGGPSYSARSDIAVDSSGSAYIIGGTDSTDFPTTAGAFDTTHNGNADVFISKLNAAGSGLVYSTFLGGQSREFGDSIAVDVDGSAYVTGSVDSTDFPTTAGAFDTGRDLGERAFVTKLNAAGSGLVYSTFLGGGIYGTTYDHGIDIAVDDVGAAHVTGITGSYDFPTTAGAFDTSHSQYADDVFVSKLNATGSDLVYSTFVGGGSGQGIAVDGAGNAYVTGNGSADFPTTAGAFDATYSGDGNDVFVAKLSPGSVPAPPAPPPSIAIEQRVHLDPVAQGGGNWETDISGNITVWADNNSGNWDVYAYDFTTGFTTKITNDLANQYLPRVSGNNVIWLDDRNGGGMDIYAYDLITNTEQRITLFSTASWDRTGPAIDGDIIAWTDNRNVSYENDIYAYDLVTGIEKRISTNPGLEHNPSISGSKIVWDDHSAGAPDVFLYDIPTAVTTKLTNNPVSAQQVPEIDGNIVVWEDERNGPGDIYSYNLNTLTETRLTNNGLDNRRPDISGSRVIYEGYDKDKGNVYSYDVNTSLSTQLTNTPWNEWAPTVSGNRAVWMSEDNGASDLFSYNLTTGVKTRLTANPPGQYAPAIDGTIVAWIDGRNGDFDIYVRDMRFGTERRLTTDPSLQGYPGISGNIVVWEDHRNGLLDIYAYDLSTNTETRITSDTVDQWRPDVYGSTVVWLDGRNGGFDVYSYDLSTGIERRITTSSTAAWSRRGPDIFGNNVVWTDNRNANDDIFAFDLSASIETQVTTDTGTQHNANISSDTVVWDDHRAWEPDIYSYNLTTRVTTQITTDPNVQQKPAIGNGKIAWEDNRNGNWEIYTYDLSTLTESRATNHPAGQNWPAVSGDNVVWFDWRNGNCDIYGNFIDTSPWKQVGLNGFGDPNNIIVFPGWGLDFNDQMYVGTRNNNGGQIWRSPDGINWSPTIIGGFQGNPDHKMIGVTREYFGKLYGFSDQLNGSAEIWESLDGINWSTATAFGLSPINWGAGHWVGVNFKGYVYSGSWGIVGGGIIHRTNDGINWTAASLPGMGDPNKIIVSPEGAWNGILFAGADGTSTPNKLFMTDNGINWTEVVINGDSSNTAPQVSYTAEFNDNLYVGFADGEIWKTSDLSDWTTATVEGFGDSDRGISEGSLRVFNGQLYMSTWESSSASQVWRTSDGITWENITPPWDIYNFVSRHITSYKGNIYIGTRNEADGGELWTFDFDNTPTGNSVSPDVGPSVNITFDQVSTKGSTVVAEENNSPASPPAGYASLDPTYYISTDATHTGLIHLSFSYDEADVAGSENNLKVFHWNGSNWVDVTTGIDTINNKIQGETNSLSPFMLAVQVDTTPPTTQFQTNPLNFDGLNGWYTTTPTITLTTTETGGSTYYQWDSTSTNGWTTYSSAFSGLEGEHTLYYYSKNVAGNKEETKPQILKVDTGNPTTPSLSSTAVNSNRIDFSWTAENDSISGLSGYRIYDADSNNQLVSVSATKHSLTSLTANTTYRYYLRAYDNAGNLSVPSNTLTITTPETPANTWITNGPYFSVINDIAISSPGNIAYAATSNVGIIKSTDGGNTWNQVSPTGWPKAFFSVAVDPGNPAVAYGAAWPGMIYKTTDSGVSWTQVSSGFPSNVRIVDLAINPTNPNLIYAAMEGNGGVYRSTDGGTSWGPVVNGLADLNVKDIAIDPTTPSTVYAGTPSGVFKSADDGQNWIGVSPGLGGIQSLAIDPTNPNIIYVGAYGAGVYKSADGGANWGPVNNGLPGTDVEVVVIDPLTPSILYVGYPTAGVFKSTDSGSSWSAANNDLSNSRIKAMAINPATPTTLYAATDGEGIFKSTNQASSWNVTESQRLDVSAQAVVTDPLDPTNVYTAVHLEGSGMGGVFKSPNGANSWTYSGPTPSYIHFDALALDPSDNTTPTSLYAAWREVYRSDDGGVSWNNLSNGLPSTIIKAIAVDPNVPGTVYVGTVQDPFAQGDGVYKTTDGGLSWSAVNNGLTNRLIHALAIDPSVSSTVYAATEGGVFKSINGGVDWSLTSLGNMTATALTIDSSNPSTIYAGTASGAFKSDDAGVNWSPLGLGGAWVSALIIDPITSTTLYAGTGNGVFISIDGGTSWASANQGLTNTNVRGLSVVPSSPRILYAATEGDVFSFKLEPPLPFDLSRPADGATIWNDKPVFAWQPTIGIVKYQLYINGSLTVDNISPTASSVQPVSALSSGSHTWYVRAIDAEGNGRNSVTTRSLTIDPNSQTWAQVNLDGFGTAANNETWPIATFNNKLYAGSINNNGGQVWETTDSLNWSASLVGGWGGNPKNIGTWPRVVNGSLFGATQNPDGAEIWKYDGVNWNQSSSFNDPAMPGIDIFQYFNGHYFAAPWSTPGAKIWWSVDGNAPWTPVYNGDANTQILRVGEAFNNGTTNYLYAGTSNPVLGGDLIRTSNGTDWSTVTVSGPGGALDKNANGWVFDAVAFKGLIYINANGASRGEIWRSPSGDSNTWTRVVSNGFNGANNAIPANSLFVNGDYLYATTRNNANGGEIWRTTDGTNWQPLMTSGFGDKNNAVLRFLRIFNGKLFVGTLNNYGSQIWAMPLNVDATPPSTPILSGFSPSSTTIDLYWSAASDNVGVTGYKVYDSSDTVVATTAATSYSLTGLMSGQTYGYYVKAYDAAGNYSLPSNTIKLTTAAGGTTSAGTEPATQTVSPTPSVSLTFSDVTADGITTVTETTSVPGSEPPGFSFQPGMVYEVHTTASFTPPVYISFNYDESALTVPEASLKLFHYEGGDWVDVTYSLDTINNVITGKVNSFSLFGVGGPPPPSTGINIVSAIVLSLLALATGGGVIGWMRPAGVWERLRVTRKKE